LVKTSASHGFPPEFIKSTFIEKLSLHIDRNRLLFIIGLCFGGTLLVFGLTTGVFIFVGYPVSLRNGKLLAINILQNRFNVLGSLINLRASLGGS
jgi:hypothetical protein